MKKQIRSLSHNSFENKEIIPNIRTESPKRAISNIKYVDNRLSEQSDHKPEPIYEEKKKQRRSPDPRISIMDLENNLEFEAFHAVQSEKIEKIEKIVSNLNFPIGGVVKIEEKDEDGTEEDDAEEDAVDGSGQGTFRLVGFGGGEADHLGSGEGEDDDREGGEQA